VDIGPLEWVRPEAILQREIRNSARWASDNESPFAEQLQTLKQ